MRHPDVLVYLDLSLAHSLERIVKRGRECERSITLEYLRALHKSYQHFVDWDEFHDAKRVAQAILWCLMESTVCTRLHCGNDAL